MSIDDAGPWAPTTPAPGPPVLARWALGLTLAAPLLLLVTGLGFRLGVGPLAQLLVGLLPVLAVPAGLGGFVLGVVALSRARRGEPGRGLAVSAVVLAATQVVLVVVPFVFLFVIFALGGFE